MCPCANVLAKKVTRQDRVLGACGPRGVSGLGAPPPPAASGVSEWVTKKSNSFMSALSPILTRSICPGTDCSFSPGLRTGWPGSWQSQQLATSLAPLLVPRTPQCRRGTEWVGPLAGNPIVRFRSLQPTWFGGGSAALCAGGSQRGPFHELDLSNVVSTLRFCYFLTISKPNCVLFSKRKCETSLKTQLIFHHKHAGD